MNVGTRIKELRKSKGISADDLAPKIGISRSTLFRYENGETDKIPSTVLLNIASALGVTLDFLLGNEETTIDQEYNSQLNEFSHNLYQKLLEKYPDSTEEGKALRYFDNKQRELIIQASIQKTLSTPVFVNKKGNSSDSINPFLANYHLLQLFTEYYQEAVKTNQNLISFVLNRLPTSEDLMNYPIYNEVKSVDLPELELSITGMDFEKSVNDELLNNIETILADCKAKIEALRKKYPDTIPQTSRNIIAIAYNKDINANVWVNTDGQDSVDEIGLSDLIKQMLIDNISKQLDK